MLSDAFNSLLNIHKRTVTLKRIASPSNLTATISISPTNYNRQTAAPSEIEISGYQFIITKKNLSAVNWTLKRGDRLVDPDLGELTIEAIEQMYDLGSAIMGFRVRTG